MPQTPNNAPTYQHHPHKREQQALVKNNGCTQPSRPGACVHPITKTVAVPYTDTSTTTTHNRGLIKKLLRKEVIQPHLPVRLPCYDFVPIADPTFDGSLTCLGHRLRVLPTFMT